MLQYSFDDFTLLMIGGKYKNNKILEGASIFCINNINLKDSMEHVHRCVNIPFFYRGNVNMT